MGFSSAFARLLLQCSSIGIGAILGVLTRIGVNTLFGPARANITSRDGVLFFDLPANVLGCFVIGFHSAVQSAWEVPPTLSLGLSTGYAGSLTSEFIPSFHRFSYLYQHVTMNLTTFYTYTTFDGYVAFASWHLQMIRMLVDGNVLQGILAMFIGLCLAVSAVVIGADFGALVTYASQHVNISLICKSRIPSQCILADGDPVDQFQRSKTDSSKLTSTGCVLAVFASLLAGMITGAVVDHDGNSSRLFWTSATLAPVGALLRWRLSFLNKLKPLFPIGTYIANMLAFILDIALLTASGIHKNLSSEAAFWFTSIIAGLGGSLSTVSTWISESLKLPTAQRYFYILSTMISALLLGLTIYGIPVWVQAI